MPLILRALRAIRRKFRVYFQMGLPQSGSLGPTRPVLRLAEKESEPNPQFRPIFRVVRHTFCNFEILSRLTLKLPSFGPHGTKTPPFWDLATRRMGRKSSRNAVKKTPTMTFKMRT